MGGQNPAAPCNRSTLLPVREPAVRIVVDEEEHGTIRSRSRWLTVTIPVLTVGILAVSTVLLRFGDAPVRAPSGTVVVDVYLFDDVGSDEKEQMLDRLGTEAIVLDRRFARPSLLLQTRKWPTGCSQVVAIRLLVASVRDAHTIAKVVIELYPSSDSAFGGIGIQHGDMSIPLSGCYLGTRDPAVRMIGAAAQP
jgi:hypothetical protein